MTAYHRIEAQKKKSNKWNRNHSSRYIRSFFFTKLRYDLQTEMINYLFDETYIIDVYKDLVCKEQRTT